MRSDSLSIRRARYRTARVVLTGALWGLSLLCAGVWAILSGLNGRSLLVLLASCAFPLSFATVGALIATRRPRNPIGWLLSAMGLTFGFALASSAYANRALVTHPGALPRPDIAVWAQDWAFLIALAPAIPVVLLFPDGRPPARSWRWTVVASVVGIMVAWLGDAFTTRQFDDGKFPTTPNPFFVPTFARLNGALMALAFVCLAAALLAALVASALRFRRAVGVERQQLKWLALAGVALLPEAVLLALTDVAWVRQRPVAHDLVISGTAALPTVIPLAIGVAILRHRLYDIDRLINRTLVYATLTALLGAGYLLGVVLLQRLFAPVTRGSNLAVAATTLALAAVAGPARGRIQAVVDRRFNRRRYDAARTLDAFSARLRTQLDLDALADEVCDVTREALQPTHVSLWLRDPDAAARQRA